MIEAWLSLVERRVRDAEAASSNLVASMIEKTLEFQQTLIFQGFLLL